MQKYYKKILSLLTLMIVVVFALNISEVAADGETVIPLPSRVTQSTVGVADFNGDNKMEFVTASEDGWLYIIDGASHNLIWQKNMADYISGYSKTKIVSGVTIGDLDLDGRLSIVVSTGGSPFENNPGAVIVLNYVGGADPFVLAPGWPIIAQHHYGGGEPDGFISTPAVGDIDGDKDLEIVIGGMDRRLYAWHDDGSNVDGWPITETETRKHRRDTISSPALADLDSDGDMEIIIGTNNYRGNCVNPYLFYALQEDGSFLDGFPIDTTQNIASSPAIGDINGDGELDIVVGTGGYSEEGCGQKADGAKVYAWDRHGQALPGWPKATDGNMQSSPALGDIDGDGDLEVIIQCHNQKDLSCTTLYAWHGDGSNVTGFPIQPGGRFSGIYQSVVVADYDGDGMVEIFASDVDGKVFSIDPNGVPVGILRYNINAVVQTAPFVADVDGDGLIETILVGSSIHIWEETGKVTDSLPWPMFGRNVQRTAVIPVPYKILGKVVNSDNSPVPNVTITLNTGLTQTTNSQGEYEFEDLTAGIYTITPTLTGYTFDPPTGTVTMPPGVSATQNFTRTTYQISGTILENAQPASGVTLGLNTGQTTTTNASGGYTFKYLPAGDYTITPVQAGYIFLPENLSATLPPNSQAKNFVRTTYQVSGKVQQANSLPYAGVTLTLNTGETTSSQVDGIYAFENLLADTRYTVTPTLVEYRFLPESREILSTQGWDQDFTILPLPVSTTLQANTVANLGYTNTQGLPSQFEFSQVLTSNVQIIITPTLASNTGNYNFAGHAFELRAYKDGKSLGDYYFGGSGTGTFGAQAPINVTITYSSADIPAPGVEEKLELLWLSNTGWQPVENTCGVDAEQTIDAINNTIEVAVCQTGEYALFSSVKRVYLPLLIK